MISTRNIMATLGAGVTAAAIALSALPALAGMAGSSGEFEGRSNHETTGGVSIVEVDGTFYVELGENFVQDGGPDPHIALGKDGYNADTELGELTMLTGKQRFEIPASIDVSDYNEVWVWCNVAGVALGYAALN